MNTGVESTQPNATPTNESKPNATSPSPAAPGSTTSPSEPFRYGSTAPSWAQGKTAEEVLGIATQLEGVVRQHIQGAPQPVQQPTYNNQNYNGGRNEQGQFTSQGWQAPQSTPAYDPDSYLQRRDIESLAPKLINDAVTPQLNSVYESLAQTNLENVKRNFSTIFEKYGPEVYGYIAKLPVQSRTVDNLTTVVKLVRADHVDEIARQEAVRLAAEMEPTLRSTGSPPVPVASYEPKNTLQSEHLPQDWKDRAAKAGLTESAVDEFCRANEMTREAFFSQFGTTAITEARR